MQAQGNLIVEHEAQKLRDQLERHEHLSSQTEAIHRREGIDWNTEEERAKSAKEQLQKRLEDTERARREAVEEAASATRRCNMLDAKLAQMQREKEHWGLELRAQAERMEQRMADDEQRLIMQAPCSNTRLTQWLNCQLQVPHSIRIALEM